MPAENERHEGGALNVPVLATRAGIAARKAGEQREIPAPWSGSIYETYWLAGYDAAIDASEDN